MWYNAIRSMVSNRITSEEERMPTVTSSYVARLAPFLLGSEYVTLFNNRTLALALAQVPKDN